MSKRSSTRTLKSCRRFDSHAAVDGLDIKSIQLALGELVDDVAHDDGAARQLVDARYLGLCGNQIFNPTSMCAYATVLVQAFLLCFENSMRAIDSSKNQPNRLRFDRDREF